MDDTSNEDEYPQASILLIDDNRANLAAVTAVLEPLGHRLVQAMSGDAALRCAMAEEFAVILVDVQMPGMDGFETVALLRKHPRVEHTPMLLFSAYHPDVTEVQRGYAAGAIDYIVKPFDPDILRAKVGALASFYRRGAELKRRAAIIAEKELESAAAHAAAQRAEMEAGLRDRFVGILGHDLRNPLGVISITSEAMMGDEQVSQRTRDRAGRMKRSADRISVMIRDLLDFTRGQFDGGIPASPVRCDLGEVAKQAVEELRVVYPERQIALRASGDLEGMWDPGRLEQMVSNLVGNAVEHGIDPIAVSTEGEETGVRLTVHNGGDPIPADSLSTIFEPFHKGPHNVKRSDRLGLGLYIVKEIAAAHGAIIDVRSSKEEGTTFACLFPRHAAAPDDPR